MALSLTNNTCDIYRSGTAPPSAPAVAGVACLLKSDFARGRESGEGDAAVLMRWTHVMLVALATDIRDSYVFGVTDSGTEDRVYVPDQNGTAFKVVFVERAGEESTSHKRVYLQRGEPAWPTENV